MFFKYINMILKKYIWTLICFILSKNIIINAQIVPNTNTEQPAPATENLPPRNSNNKDILGDWLLFGCLNSINCKTESFFTPVEYPGYDGWYNNIADPELGAIDTPLLRRWPAVYADGTYKPLVANRPNPLTLSQELLASSTIGTSSRTGKNALLVFFGQQVVEEILDAQRAACPPEYFNIPIPPGHEYESKVHHKEMPVLRTRYDMRTGVSPNNPRQQLNEITPFIDGNLMYGSTKAWSDVLRTNENGTFDRNGLLASSYDGLFPAKNNIRLPMANPPPPAYHKDFIKKHELLPVNRFFRLGNPRGNENPYLLTFGVLWFRWHNYLAKRIKHEFPSWSSEKIYNEARKWVIGTQQHIVVHNWLPEWLGKNLTKYKGYDPSVNPQIDQFFQAAAFRFGHTLVTPGVYLRDYGRSGCDVKGTVRTCNSFWRPHEFFGSNIPKINEIIDIDHFLMGMAYQLTEEEDHKIVEDLRGRVFGPLEFSRRDLMAINIQRGRDHGLPDFNSARKAYGLSEIKTFNHFKYVDDTIKNKLRELYNNSLNNIDPWVGGILETGDGPGELFQTVIADQFQRIRDGDRFWFENKANGLFTLEQIKRIKTITIYDIIMAVTKMNWDDIPVNPFRVPLSNSPPEVNSRCTSKLVLKNCIIERNNSNSFNCYHLPILDAKVLAEECVMLSTYDYFNNSEVSYILSFTGLATVILGILSFIWILNKQKTKKMKIEAKHLENNLMNNFLYARNFPENLTPYPVNEWQSSKRPYKPAIIFLHVQKKQIQVLNSAGEIVRAIDFTHLSSLEIFVVSDGVHILLRVVHDYDLMLQFESEFLRKNFVADLEQFIETLNLDRKRVNSVTLKVLLKTIVTRKDRQARLEKFFRVVFSQAFKINHSEDEILMTDASVAREVIYTELTLTEFADALSMRSDSEFVQKMFALVDKDKNGFVSFREFVDMLVIFAKGTADEKAKLMFDMYDINGTKELTREDFTNMLKSLLETVHAQVNQKELENTVLDMMKKAGLERKSAMNFKDFMKLLENDKDKLNFAQLEFSGVTDKASTNIMQQAHDTFESIYADPEELRTRVGGEYNAGGDEVNMIEKEMEFILENPVQTKKTYFHSITRYIAHHTRELFWVILFTLVLLAIFAERAYYYSVEREHSGLRRIAGYGVTVTRGAASAMMFAYSSLLITMCRNTITFLRDTVLHVYIPFDSSIEMHKYIAGWAGIFTVIHIIGHAFNFYHISTQTAEDLTCLFRNYFRATHELPKFHYWLWETMTGFTGVVLTVITAIMYSFAIPFVRRKLYNWFWYTHSLYPLFYLFLILHGSGRLIQEPFFHYFFLGPAVLYTLDYAYSLSRKKIQIPVLKAEILPSDVTMLEFKKPNNFVYKSGQWVRIACLGHSAVEYHPFTLSSSPHEPNLTVHIRAVGPWTMNIRSLYDSSLYPEKALPKIYLDGPFGEAHQDWYQYDISVLIGGGIGVTPFASILKDIVQKSNNNESFKCGKVYFLWVTRTQKQFEWLVDIIRGVESTDKQHLVSVHLFITQFYQKFDLRTVLLYICERHFQRTANKSLFTGLKAVTHFGRPNFLKFFRSLKSIHSNTNKIGVFSCGPPPMTQGVDKDAVQINTESNYGPIFQHYFKNF